MNPERDPRMGARLRRLEAAGFPIIRRAIETFASDLLRSEAADTTAVDLTVELVELVTKLEAK